MEPYPAGNTGKTFGQIGSSMQKNYKLPKNPKMNMIPSLALLSVLCALPSAPCAQHFAFCFFCFAPSAKRPALCAQRHAQIP